MRPARIRPACLGWGVEAAAGERAIERSAQARTAKLRCKAPRSTNARPRRDSVPGTRPPNIASCGLPLTFASPSLLQTVSILRRLVVIPFYGILYFLSRYAAVGAGLAAVYSASGSAVAVGALAALATLGLSALEARGPKRACLRACVCACAYVRTRIRVRACACIRMRMRACVCAQESVRVQAGACACACVLERARARRGEWEEGKEGGRGGPGKGSRRRRRREGAAAVRVRPGPGRSSRAGRAGPGLRIIGRRPLRANPPVRANAGVRMRARARIGSFARSQNVNRARARRPPTSCRRMATGRSRGIAGPA